MSESIVATMVETPQSKPVVVKRGSVFARHPLATVFGPMAAAIAVSLLGPIELFLCVLGFVVVLEFPLLTTVIVYGNRAQRSFAIGALMSLVVGWFVLLFCMGWIGRPRGGEKIAQIVGTIAWLGTIGIGMICDGVRRWLEWAAGRQGPGEAAPSEEFSALPRVQFSLRSMLVLMTLVAVLCSLLFSTSSALSVVIILFVNVAWSGLLVSMLVYTRGYLQTFCVGALVPATMLLLMSIGWSIEFGNGLVGSLHTPARDYGFRVVMAIWWLAIVLSGLLAVVMRRTLARRSRLAVAEALNVDAKCPSRDASPAGDPWQQDEALGRFVTSPEKDISGEPRA